MIAIIQNQHVVAVGKDDRHALAAAFAMPYFDPRAACLFVPAETVDPALCPKKTRKS